MKTGTKPARAAASCASAPSALPLSFEAEAGDHADDRPAPVLEVEERGGAADGLVVGVRGDMDQGGGHNQGGYVPAWVPARRGLQPRYARSPPSSQLSCAAGARSPGEGGPGRGGSLMLQVVGAGVGRTGTHSLKIALEQLLGGPCHHMIEVFGHPDEVPVWTDAIDGRPVDWAQAHGGLHGAGRLAGGAASGPSSRRPTPRRW